MSYIEFDKNQLINLEYSLSRELVRSNRSGAYATTTIINCNTRKYHGLLIAPQPGIDGENHVLLSTLDETIIQHDAEFNLGLHKFPGDNYSPKGHKYVRNFEVDRVPVLTYRIGGVVLTKERVFHRNDDRILIKYTLVDANSPTKIRFKPFLAFRSIHHLTHENIYYDNKFEKIKNGIRVRMYPGYTPLFMQFSKSNDYTHVPHWYYNIEYYREQERGYDYQEDLYVPGYFEMDIKKGESIVFSAGLSETNPQLLKRVFNKEIESRPLRNDFKRCLDSSAQQFIVKREHKTGIVAGYPWFGQWGRDTFISLPGLTLLTGDYSTAKSIIDTLVEELDGPLFPNIGIENKPVYNSVDAPLWFFWALQQYAEFADKKAEIWKLYGRKMKLILDGLRNGTRYNIKMDDDGLIFAGDIGLALTWMDVVINGKPVTPRTGKQVEINALWYNAVGFSLEMAKLAGDKKFVSEWKEIPDRIELSYINTFWDEERGYLADFVNGDYKDWSVRPNQIFATSLPYKFLSEDIRSRILERVENELLTPRGLRTLSPKNPDYKGIYTGDQAVRDRAYHQGTVWPWLLGHFVEGYLKIYDKNGLDKARDIYHGFEAVMSEAGIGSISEVYDGDPPHLPGGAISQAWSVAELLRINWLINKYSKDNNK